MLVLCMLATACAVDNPPLTTSPVRRSSFECAVQPVLVQHCSMPACHGNPSRKLQVLAPGRMRLAGELAQAQATQAPEDHAAGYHPPLTWAETDFNFHQARSMVLQGQAPDDCALLNRPLAVSAGGLYHAPGGDVFSSVDDPGYQALRRWLAGAGPEICP